MTSLGTGQSWVLVASMAEVEPGMTLLLRGCLRHGRDCVMLVLRVRAGTSYHWDIVGGPGSTREQLERCDAARLMRTTHHDDDVCACDAISERRLFRLELREGETLSAGRELERSE